MLPAQITFKDVPVSQAIETYVRRRIRKLSQYYQRISSCRVVLELPQNHKHQGRLYNARVDVKVPGKELAVTKKQDEDIYVAIRDAFDAIERRLDALSNKRKGNVKSHESFAHGHVVRLIPEESCGFIEDLDGNEYYFSLTNVHHPDFDQLRLGDAVTFATLLVQNGRQALHITRISCHNIH